MSKKVFDANEIGAEMKNRPADTDGVAVWETATGEWLDPPTWAFIKKLVLEQIHAGNGITVSFDGVNRKVSLAGLPALTSGTPGDTLALNSAKTGFEFLTPGATNGQILEPNGSIVTSRAWQQIATGFADNDLVSFFRQGYDIHAEKFSDVSTSSTTLHSGGGRTLSIRRVGTALEAVVSTNDWAGVTLYCWNSGTLP